MLAANSTEGWSLPLVASKSRVCFPSFSLNYLQQRLFCCSTFRHIQTNTTSSLKMDAQQSSNSVVPKSTAGKDKDLTNSLLEEERSIRNGDQDLLQGEKVDEVLAAKMTIINDVGNQYPRTMNETPN